jgi:hypothetical protein
MEVTAEGSESLMEATMVSVEVAGAFVEDPFLDVLGKDSSPDASKATPMVVSLRFTLWRFQGQAHIT